MSTFIAASVWALYEFDLKKVVALSTIRQLGLIGVSLGNHLPQLAFVHLSVHALFKSGLFIITGMVILANGGQQDSRVITPRSNNFTPVTKFALLNSFSLASVPFSGGFYSKEMLENAIYSSSYIRDIRLVIFFSSVPLTVAYAFRLIRFFFTGNPKSPPLTSSKLRLNISLFFTCSLGSLRTILITK